MKDDIYLEPINEEEEYLIACKKYFDLMLEEKRNENNTELPVINA